MMSASHIEPRGDPMRRAVVVLAVIVTVVTFSAADASAGPIKIRGASCRGEWVDVVNTSNAPKSLRGFRLFDHGRLHRFDFPNDNLASGGVARVWAEGKRGGPYRKWYTGWNDSVWNNDGDRAYLVNPLGAVVSTKNCGDAGGP